MSILLKNVVAAAPAAINLTVPADTNGYHVAAQKVPIADIFGVAIDATAGTISTIVKVDKLSLDQNTGKASFTSWNGNASMSTDLTASGFLTLLMADNPNDIYPGTYQVDVTAIDSAGGSRQCLAQGTLTVKAS